MFHTKIALIPAYEPGDTLLPLTKQLAQAGYTVVVVDDGSGLDYAPLFDRLRPWAQVLSYRPNQGKGHALKIGLHYLQEHAARDGVVVTLDCDGQHTADDADRVVVQAARQPDALTLGVRGFGAGTPPRSRFGNTVTRAVYHLSTGKQVSDTQTGLRAFGMALLPMLREIPGERYEYEMNVLLVCSRQGIPIREVPVQTIYREGNRGSHFRTLRDSLCIYRHILKFTASSLAGFAIDYSLYSLLAVMLSGLGIGVSILIANVSARVVSAGVNFTLNRKLVFHSGESVWKTGSQYFALAAGILVGNTAMLSLLVDTLDMNQFAAKLVTEITFFALSFVMQHFFIFSKKQPETSVLPEAVPEKTRQSL